MEQRRVVHPATIPMLGRCVVTTLAISLALQFALATSVYAHYFGSNTAGYGTAAHPCDTSIYSQCIANNGVHIVYVCCFASDEMYQPTVDALNFIDSQVIDVVTNLTTNDSTADVLTFQGNYGDSGWWAYGACWGSYTVGGNDPSRWCRPQAVHYNVNSPSNWDGTYTGRKVVACHELGHTLGLRHYGDSSCMRMGVTSSAYYVLNTDQIGHLNAQY